MRAPFSPLLPFLSVAAIGLAGCESLAVSLAGAGATAALGATFAGISHRTFTAPLQTVKQASLAALEAMGVTLESSAPSEAGEVLVARAGARTVQIELEGLTPRATRMRVSTTDGSLFYDAATATEIVAQTERALERPAGELARSAKRVRAVN